MDIRTLFAAMAAANLAYAFGIFLYVKGQHSIHPSIQIWGQSRLFAGMGVILLAMRDKIIPAQVDAVVAYPMMLMAVTLSVLAFRSCLDRPMRGIPSIWKVFSGFVLLAIGLLVLGVPENSRLSIFMIFYCTTLVVISIDLAKGWSGNSLLQKFLAIYTPVLAAIATVRAIEALLRPAEGAFTESSLHVVGMFFGFVETIFTSFGFLLLAKEKTDHALEMQAGTDHLTGLPNRRSFYAMAEKVFSLEKRAGKAVTLLFLDIDDFKKINDKFGHDAGDRVLVAFADILRSTMRQCDFLVRLGGEEFGVLMPDTPPDSAKDAAERIRQAVEGSDVRLEKGAVRFTVSIGLYGENSASSPDMDVYFRCADAALYRAKENGKNRVEIERAGA